MLPESRAVELLRKFGRGTYVETKKIWNVTGKQPVCVGYQVRGTTGFVETNVQGEPVCSGGVMG